MIYLFAGDDAKNKRKAYENFLKSRKGEEVFFVDADSFDPAAFENLYAGSGLFFSKVIVSLENIFENEKAETFVLGKLKEIADSQNDFVFLEGKLNKQVIDSFKKVRAELNVFEAPKERKERFNSFILANALGSKDKLNLWIYFRQAMNKNVALEELAGILFWKAKDMIIKKNFAKFSEGELQNFASRISYLLPQARKEGKDDEAAFEQFLLEAF